MTDELQTNADESGTTLDNDHIENNETGTQAGATVESGAELATASGEDQTKNEDGAQRAINKQHAKFREQERRADELEADKQKLQEKLAVFEAEKGEVIIPPAPDPYDEDYEAQLKVRDEAIMLKARQDTQQESAVSQQQANKEAAKKAESERVGGLIEGYTKQISTLGLSAEEIRVAGETVVKNGIDGQVAEYILGDKDGPLITQYLAKNPIIQDELRHLPTIEAAMKINSEIRQNAVLNKPQASATPDPTEILKGRGAPANKDPRLNGVTYL